MTSPEDGRETFYEAYWKAGRVADSPHQRWKLAALRESLAEIRYQSILDVGAGDGVVLSRVASPSARRVAVDFADDALARASASGLEACKVDIENDSLPFPGGTFDVTLCLDVLEHVFAPEALLAEIARVTAPRGRLILSVPNAFNLANRLAYLFGRHIDVMDVAHRTGATFSEHVRFFSEPVLDKIVAASKLTIVERKYYFPSEFSDIKTARWAAKAVTIPRLHERLPSLFALGFFAVCAREA